MSYLWIFLFASLAIKAKAQGFDLADALDDDVPTKAPIPKVPADPKKPSDGGLDLFDALLPDPKDPDPPKPKAPGDGFDLSDALGPDPEPKKPAVIPPRDGGTDGGSFGDSDLTDLIGGDSGYKPDKGKGGGHIHDPSSDYDGGRGFDDGRQKEAGSSKMTGILSTVGVAIVGAICSYFAYKKRQRCAGLGGNQRRGGGGFNIPGFGSGGGGGFNIPGFGSGGGGGGGFRGRGEYDGRGNHPAGGGGGRGGGAAGVISNLLNMV